MLDRQTGFLGVLAKGVRQNGKFIRLVDTVGAGHLAREKERVHNSRLWQSIILTVSYFLCVGLFYLWGCRSWSAVGQLVSHVTLTQATQDFIVIRIETRDRDKHKRPRPITRIRNNKRNVMNDKVRRPQS